MPAQWSLPKADSYFEKLLNERGFQIDHLDAALKHCKRFGLAVDGGAHIGTWTVALAERFETVLAFEPAPDTFDCLKSNIKAHVAPWKIVKPFNLALGDVFRLGTMSDDASRPGNTGSRYFLPGVGRSIAMQPLDSFDFGRVDFLKLDVEGAELMALKGAEQTIKRSETTIVMEVKRLRAGHDPEAAVRWLERQGWREVGRIGKDRVYVF